MALQARSDQVGSLLRPPELLRARAEHQAGRLTADELRRIEDNAILGALEMQRQAGIAVLTDGELRRDAWMTDLSDAVEGFVDDHQITRWHGPGGEVVEEPRRAKVVGGRLRRRRRLTEHESVFLVHHADRPVKITMPSPAASMVFAFKPGVTDRFYASREELVQELVDVVRTEIQALVAEGVRYIQLDEGFAPYVDPASRKHMQQQGLDPAKLLDTAIAAENACYDAVSRADVTFGIHICRGNSRSRWSGSGGYDWLAERLFSDLHADRFLLEYDSERAGGFAPLRYLPKGKTVVLGLVTTKEGRLEPQDDLLRRIDEATKYAPIEQLALSPQCGFASVSEGNLLSQDEQRRKLELVADTARKVWG